jgi:hypothetical protein
MEERIDERVGKKTGSLELAQGAGKMLSFGALN